MKKSVLYAFLTFLILQAGATELFAQSAEVKARRQAEHQAFKNFVSKKVQEAPRAQKTDPKALLKDNPNSVQNVQGQELRQSYFMNGNRISTEIYNYGGIAPGLGGLRDINNVVWKNIGYVFAFCPIVGASVPDPDNPGERQYIITDGLMDYTSPLLREVSPDGDTLWQWQPLPGYSDPDQERMASNPAPDSDDDGKPDSWPRDWYNETLGRYVWPGYLKQDALSADLEVFWAMDDRENKEFSYQPSPVSDPQRGGIGVQIDGRAFQWSNPLAENTIFFVYTITNTSEKDLDSLFFGIYGDPDIGGGSPENTDDNGYFIPPKLEDSPLEDIPVYQRSMVFFWDPDGENLKQLPLGYLGCKFLESPGHPSDNEDNDGDGMIDERQDDGIDNDGDWNPAFHDVGVDGIPGTDDEGELDGVPTAGRKLADGSLDPLFPGEPNFELTDLDESDQIGLTSFNSWSWSNDRISNDLSMWNRSIPGNFGQITQNTDIVFIFGSGYISLKAGETKRISMALLFGEDLDDLLISAETVQTIYNNNYQFFKPPETPTLTAVPDDRKVTLYWDNLAEESIDPISGKDFEGYVLYRSTSPEFADIRTITDGKGSEFLAEPLKTFDGVEAKWDVATRPEPYNDENGNGQYDVGEPFKDVERNGVWDASVDDWWVDYHPVPYPRRGIQYYLGKNSGLEHSFVDSNNVINGETYYYALVAYDHGDSTISPTESTKKITEDPITGQLSFDLNTVSVIPGPRAIGYQPPPPASESVTHVEGIGTGDILLEPLNDLAIEDGGRYEIVFNDSLMVRNEMVEQLNYSVLKLDAVSNQVVLFDTKFANLGHGGISLDSYLSVKNSATGEEYTLNEDYILDVGRGVIRRTDGSRIPVETELDVQYRYFPVYQSARIDMQDDNPVFNGLKLKVKNDHNIVYDKDRSGWVEGNTNFRFNMGNTSLFLTKEVVGADYEVQWSSSPIDSALILDPGSGMPVMIPVRYSVKDVTYGVPKPVLTFLIENNTSRNSKWDPGEEISLFKLGSKGTGADTVTWGIFVNIPQDTSVTPVPPTDGDVLFLSTNRPFNNDDIFRFTSSAASFSQEEASNSLDNVYVVPNPYVAFNELEPTNRLPGQSRGERRIYFENLPPECTIRIYTMAGDLVNEIHRNTGIENGREFWNLLNKDGFSVAYGVYFAHIDAPEVGERLIKFAIIK